MAKNKHSVGYFETMFPGYFAVVIGEQALRAELKRLKVDDIDALFENSPNAQCINLVSSIDGSQYLILWFCEKALDSMEYMQIIGLAMHEAVHAKQLTMASIKEKTPGVEVEAYICQFYAQNAVQQIGMFMGAAWGEKFK